MIRKTGPDAMKIFMLTLVTAILLLPGPASALVLYVDGGDLGDNANDGFSVSTPLKTVQAAISRTSTGENTIYVRGANGSFDGVYHLSSPVAINVGGTDADHRMTISGYGQERPVFNGPTSGTSHGIDLNADYITIRQLRVQNATGTGIRSTFRVGTEIIDVEVYHNNTSWAHDAGIYHFGGSDHLIKDCRVWNNNGHGIKIGDSNINNVTIEGCTVHNNGNYPGMNDTGYLRSHPMGISVPDAGGYHTIRNNTIYSNAFMGINLRSIGGTGYNEVYGNTVFDNNHHRDWSYSDQGDYGEIGIVAGHSSRIYRNRVYGGVQYGIAVGDHDCEVFNNLVYDNGSYQLAVNSNVTGTKVYNNTFSSSTSSAVVQFWVGTSSTMMNNVIYRQGSGKCVNNFGSLTRDYNLYFSPSGSVGYSLNTNEKYGDPDFVDAAIGNFHRDTGSPYVNQALNLGTPYDLDLDLNQRGVLWDFGAYTAHSSDSMAPDRPWGLTVVDLS